MVWGGTPALEGGGFELLLDYNCTKRVGCCCAALGQFVRCYLPPVAVGSG